MLTASMPRTLKLTLAYDGTDFSGWQRQPGFRTVQQVVEEAFEPLEGRAVRLVGAGRTDAGVHAAGQVASVPVASGLSCETLARALNARLPDEVRVLAVEDAAPDFNARRAARRKSYRYWIWNGTVIAPQLRRYAWHVARPLDAAVMTEAAPGLCGTHDFAAFQAGGSDVRTTVRTIVSSTVQTVEPVGPMATLADGRLLVYEVTGDGFLRHMVRAIVGTLVDVGWQGRGDMPAVLAARDRAAAGATAPPHGLSLWRVEFGGGSDTRLGSGLL